MNFPMTVRTRMIPFCKIRAATDSRLLAEARASFPLHRGYQETCRSVSHRRENRPNLTTLPRTQGCDSSGAPAVCLRVHKSGRPSVAGDRT